MLTNKFSKIRILKNANSNYGIRCLYKFKIDSKTKAGNHRYGAYIRLHTPFFMQNAQLFNQDTYTIEYRYIKRDHKLQAVRRMLKDKMVILEPGVEKQISVEFPSY